jgi:beta-galactosidase/beta-glucuronidase
MRRFIFLILLCAIGVLSVSTVSSQEQQLLTRWAADVTPDNVLPEYPRPQLVREQWLNLNGLWDYAITNLNAEQPTDFEGEILVPFPIESVLSGVHERVQVRPVWYHRVFTIPEAWAGQRVLLHFGAVDWEAKVWVNGQEIGTHRGGYDPFSWDITDALVDMQAEQELVVRVIDPTEGTQPRGKQVFNPDAIWYTPTTGIWQTVWLEPVPDAHIEGLKLGSDIDRSIITVQANVSGGEASAGYTFSIDVLDGEDIIATATGEAANALEIPIENPKLWSPDSPFLYDLRVTLKENDAVQDSVTSYTGMRKIAMQPDEEGVLRLWLNNAPLFQYGLLDQGFWPDGLYTAPTDEALRYDIEVTRDLGFNLIRKHVKVEPERWYYWADKLGVLVWQDMPSGDDFAEFGFGEIERSEKSAEQFELELQRMVDTHANHPSIVMWVIFNEGWGQYDTERLSSWLEAYDPSRLVNGASGWNDMGAGHVRDIHSYPGPDAPRRDPERVSVLGEFGGLGLPIAGHTWLAENSWGYQEYGDAETLLEGYTGLVQRLRELQETRGLAAAIYTQTTDVETEVNGIMTYDRELIKMGADEIRAVNSILFEPLPADN